MKTAVASREGNSASKADRTDARAMSGELHRLVALNSSIGNAALLQRLQPRMQPSTLSVGNGVANAYAPAVQPTPVRIPFAGSWIELHAGVFAYLPSAETTLIEFAAYVSTHPEAPAALAALNSFSPTQTIYEEEAIIVPMELIDRPRAFADMPESVRESIVSRRLAQANNEALQRFVKTQSGHPMGPGAFGLIPVTTQMVRQIKQGLKHLGADAVFVAAFLGGAVHGILQSVWDMVADTASMLFGIVKSLITAEFMEDLAALARSIQALSWEGITESIREWAGEWQEKMSSSNPYHAGHARGFLTGRAIGSIALLVLTGGAIAALKGAAWVSKLGQVLKASRAVRTLETGLVQLVRANEGVRSAVNALKATRLGPVVAAAEAAGASVVWSAKKIMRVLELPEDVARYAAVKILDNIARLEPYFERIRALSARAKAWLLGPDMLGKWDAADLAETLDRLSNSKIEALAAGGRPPAVLNTAAPPEPTFIDDYLPPALRMREPDSPRPPGVRDSSDGELVAGTIHSPGLLPTGLPDDRAQLTLIMRPGSDPRRISLDSTIKELERRGAREEAGRFRLGRIEQRAGLEPGTLGGVRVEFGVQGPFSREPPTRGFMYPEQHMITLHLDHLSAAVVTDDGVVDGKFLRSGRYAYAHENPVQEAASTAIHEATHVDQFANVGPDYAVRVTRFHELEARMKQEKFFPTQLPGRQQRAADKAPAKGLSVAQLKEVIDSAPEYAQLPTGDDVAWKSPGQSRPREARTLGVVGLTATDVPRGGLSGYGKIIGEHLVIEDAVVHSGKLEALHSTYALLLAFARREGIRTIHLEGFVDVPPPLNTYSFKFTIPASAEAFDQFLWEMGWRGP